MSYLQLADNGNPADKYLLIPAEISGTETKFVREDLFDDLPEAKYQHLLNTLEPYQLSEGDYLQDKASRQARREARKLRKGDRQAQKDRRREAKTLRKEARTLYKQKQAEGVEGFQRSGVLSNVMDTIGGVASNIFGGAGDLDYDVVGGIDYSGGQFTTDGNLQVRSKTWIKGVPNWVVIAGGGALTLGTIYLLTKKKKR